MKAHWKLLAGLIAGIVLGSILHPMASEPWLAAISTHVLQPVGQLFLRLLFMIVVPMVFSALVMGVFELGTAHGLGRVAGRTLFYTALASSASVVIGIVLVGTFRPGDGFARDAAMVQAQAQAQAVQKIQANAEATKPLSQTLVEFIPRNPLDSAVRALDGEMLQLMIFALIFGFALALGARGSKDKNPLIAVLEQIFEACLKIVDGAMKLAPFAVFALVFNTAVKLGPSAFSSLLTYVLLVVVGLALQQFLVYGALLAVVARRSPLAFFSACRDVYLHAFSTASSNATLPLSLETAEQVLGIPRRISRFVLTVGSTANQNGTALFEGITVLFLAQVYGVDLSLGDQILVVVMSIVAGIGTAGVPGGSLPMIMILLGQVGVPPEGLGLVLGVDRFLDMCRTTLNVSGDLVIAAVVSRDFPPDVDQETAAPALATAPVSRDAES